MDDTDPKYPPPAFDQDDEAGSDEGEPTMPEGGVDLEDSDEEPEGLDEMTEEDRRFLADDSSEEDGGGDEQQQQHRRKRKRKKTVIDDELDEDDLDLVEENTGLKVKEERSFKRLKKRKDRDDEPSSLHRPSSGLDAIFDDDNDDEVLDEMEVPEDDFIVDDEGPDDVAMYRRAQQQERGRHSLYGVDYTGATEEAMGSMLEIFGDGTEYLGADQMFEELKASETMALTQQPGHSDEMMNDDLSAMAGIKLTDVFEPSEVVEKMLTERDEEIRVVDVPERMQAKQLPIPDQTELDESVEHCTLVVMRSKNMVPDPHQGLPAPMLETVRHILGFLRQQQLEVPFILRHRQDYWAKELRDEDVWLIAEEDEKFHAMYAKRQALLKKASQIGAIEDPVVEEAILHLKTEDDVNDLNDYITFKHAASLVRFMRDNQRASGGYRQALRLETYDAFRTPEMLQFIHAFLLKDEHLVDNIRSRTRINIPDTPDDDIFARLSSVLPRGITDPIKFQPALEKYLAKCLVHLPQLRQFLRKELLDKGLVTVTPTEAGKRKIQPGHEYFPLKYIRNKPLRDIPSATWLDYHEAEKQGLVSLAIDFSGKEDIFLRLANYYMQRQHDEWNDLRQRIFNQAQEMLVALLTEGLRESMLRAAHLALARECETKLGRLVSVRPYSIGKRDKTTSQNYARTLALALVQQGRNYMVYGAICDDHGQLVDYYADQFDLPEFGSMVSKYRPDVVVLGVCQNVAVWRLLEFLKTRCSEHGVPYELLADSAAQAFQDSVFAKSEFPDFTAPIRYCVGLARQLQDPSHMVACLFPDDILKIEMHRNQHLVPEGVLRSLLERAMVRVIGFTGVDINDAFQYKHLSHTLQFVPGLGPRKAAGILHRMQSFEVLNSREALITRAIMARLVFLNCASFIRISESYVEDGEYEPLDDTRIHPEDYTLARKMAKDALEIDEAGDEDDGFPSRCIEELWHSGRVNAALDELSLDDYARVVEEQLRYKKRITLDFIRHELKTPNCEFRLPFVVMPEETLVQRILGKPLETGALVKARINQVKENLVRCVLDNGMEGIIWPRNISEDHEFGSSSSAVKVGQHVQAVVQEFDKTRFNVSLSLLKRDIDYAQDLIAKKGLDKFWDEARYKAEKEEERRAQHKARFSTTGAAGATNGSLGPAATSLTIKHPLFRAMNSNQAQEYLSSKDRGAAVVRPSSLGENHVAISWRVAPGVVQHLDIVQDPKTKLYYINKAPPQQPNDPYANNGYKAPPPGTEMYEDLDEILFRYVDACTKQIAKLAQHRKYVDGGREELEHKLTRDVKTFPDVIAYGICPNAQFPGYFHILYQRTLGRPSEHGFKVVPNGFVFNRHVYNDPEAVVVAFKQMIAGGGR